MIVVRVELWSARTGEKTELARMRISNDGTGVAGRNNYRGVTFRGRWAEALDREVAVKTAEVRSWPSERLHVWNLVAAMLDAMGYLHGR